MISEQAALRRLFILPMVFLSHHRSNTHDTLYPHVGWHEQRPADWWKSICVSTKRLLESSKADKNEIEGLAISGHSLGVVPVDKDGNLLRETAPIWSDTRAQKRRQMNFSLLTAKMDWYMMTGNGFPSHLYSAFKLMWYRKNEPEMFRRIARCCSDSIVFPY